MRKRKVIGIIVLLSALALLTTCQMQLNASTADSLALRLMVPGTSSAGGASAPGAGSRSLAGGTSVTVTISPQGTTGGSPQTLSASIGGKSSVDISFSLSSAGLYLVTAKMLDGSGTLLSTASAPLTVPTGNYPVVLRMPSNLLSAVLTSFGSPWPLTPAFSPTVYSYTSSPPYAPFALTLTTVDPNATVTSVTETGFNANGMPFTIVDTPTGSTYALTLPGSPTTLVTIVVRAVDGDTQKYTMTL
ncbi:MAG: cadherin-like beta sandwich domain-containing protein [Spirochaetia bacterium]|jgi:hypothetical protein